MRKVLIGLSLATMFVTGVGVGYVYHDKHQKISEVEEVKPQRKVEYEVASIEGDEYLGVSNEYDKYGMRQGLKFTPQQAGKRLNLGDKVTGVWRGSKLIMVIAKDA
ncbi:hypothetical protein [Bacillus mycoides]|uniref:hypothetical protein n=1 Tax=Bacillus mycoides TaxID=1405 RepID=UPI003D652A5B